MADEFHTKFFTVRPKNTGYATYVTAWNLRDAVDHFVSTRRPLILVKSEPRNDSDGVPYYDVTLGDGCGYIIYETPVAEIKSYIGETSGDAE